MSFFRIGGRRLEWLIVSSLTTLFLYIGYQLILQPGPHVTLYAQTQYPREVVRGGFFWLSFDLSFDKSCSVHVRRVIIGADKVEYLAQEEIKEVKASERMQYNVRIPVSASIPFGDALVRSDFEYGCNIWSRWISAVQVTGQLRPIKVVPFIDKTSAKCGLEEEPGYTVVNAYYRKDRND